jgi:RNA polymerase sigma-70 factor (ECF subfamily)
MNSDREQELMARIRAGDKTACDECIREHSPGVYRLAMRLMRDAAEAEDVVQETFLSAFKAIDRFDGRSGLQTWLYRIAYNAALMRLRRRRPDSVPMEELIEPEEGAPVPRALVDWCCLPEQELERAEVRAEIERAIRELPPKLRAVFVMRELEEFSTAGAAASLGVSEETVKTRLRRARLRLKERLAGRFAPRAGDPGD